MKTEQLLVFLLKLWESGCSRSIKIGANIAGLYLSVLTLISKYRTSLYSYLEKLLQYLDSRFGARLRKLCTPTYIRIKSFLERLDERYGAFGDMMHRAITKNEHLMPENIHRALRIIYPRSWIPQIVLGFLLLTAIGFLLFGKIPITSKGNAMFITRNTVIPFQSTASGQIVQVMAKVGDYVKKRQVLLVLAQPLIEKELKQARQQLADIQERNSVSKSLLDTYTNLEKEAIGRKQKNLDERYAVLENEVEHSKQLAEEMRTRKDQYQARNLQDVQALHELEIKRAQELAEKLKRTEELRKQELRSEDAVLDARQSVSDQAIRIADMDAQIIELKGQNVSGVGSYLDTLQQIVEKQDAAMDLAQERNEQMNRLAQIEEQYATANYAMEKETSELARQIAAQEKQLKQNREILSEFDGRILELTAGEGKLVSRGQRLGSIDARTSLSALEAVAYFTLADGKKIKPGMKLRLVPAMVQQERYGSLLASVSSVSSFPVTTEGVATVVGNSKIAGELTKDGHQIEVFAELQIDNTTVSGYKWDKSDGPEIKVEPGTLASALVNIKERAPITFIIPMTKD